MDFTTGPALASVIPGREPATCMSYHEDGTHLFVAEGDTKLRLINCQTGTSDQPAVKCERDRIHLVEATHHDLSVLIAGKGSRDQPFGQRNAINYLSLHDNKTLRKFRGHAGEITGVSMCPADDTFLSASTDRTVRLWTLQQAGCMAQMELPTNTVGNPHATFDKTGLVFAITVAMPNNEGHHLHLYDARNYGAGAFAELKIPQNDIEKAIRAVAPDRSLDLGAAPWNSIDFNTSGNQLLIKADQGLCLLLDGFEGTVQRALVSSKATARAAVACFTPDDRTVLVGNENGTISCWNAETGGLIKTLEGHLGPVGCVAANPKYAQFASSCSNTALWLW